MKKRILILGMVLAMLGSVFSFPTSNVRAEDENKNKKLDLVMVLDKSGSMKGNDPNGLMKTAANMLTAMMPAKSGRVGVVAFNIKSEQVVGLTELTDVTSVNDIMGKVSTIKYKGDTNIGDAVSDAVDMFDLNDDHVHAVLVLSDGKPDFGLDKNAEQASDERLNDTLAKIKGKECYIYALGFGKDMADTNDVPYKKLSSIVTSPETISTETDPAKIHEFFVKMLLDLIGAKIPEIYDNKIPIEPNVKEANIYISSAEDMTDVTVGLTDPSGNSIPMENSEKVWFFKDSYSAVIKLFDPAPGEYVISTSREDINITVGYVPFYDYTLRSEIVDETGVPVEKLDNGKTVEIRTCLSQEEQDVTEPMAYDNVTAMATVTAKDTGESVEVPLTFRDGMLRGNMSFERVAAYTVDIRVESETFDLKDQLTVETNQRGFGWAPGQTGVDLIEKKILDKTLKKEVTLLVDNQELMGAIEDPDGVGVALDQVTSSDEEKVTAEITNDGILLTGKKWGSSLITVTYRDGLGNTLETSFTTSVKDKMLIAFFAALPVLLGLIAALVVYLIMRQSRMIRGDFEITRVTIDRGDSDVSIISIPKSYKGKTFVGRKKTLGNGVSRYAQDVYSTDGTLLQVQQLYQMFSNTQSEMRQNLDTFQFIGSYLGRNGCSIKVKKGSPVSLSNNRSYRQAVKMKWPQKATFKVFTKDASGTEICVEGRYAMGRKAGASAAKGGKGGRGGRQNAAPTPPPVQNNNDFDEDFFS